MSDFTCGGSGGVGGGQGFRHQGGMGNQGGGQRCKGSRLEGSQLHGGCQPPQVHRQRQRQVLGAPAAYNLCYDTVTYNNNVNSCLGLVMTIECRVGAQLIVLLPHFRVWQDHPCPCGLAVQPA